MKKTIIVFMLLITSLTYSQDLYSSSLDTTQKIEIKPNTKKNLIGLEIIGTPLKLSYSRLIFEKNKNFVFFGTAIHPFSGLFWLNYGFPNFSFFLSHQISLTQKTSFYYDIGIETMQYYFPTIINNKNRIADFGAICTYFNTGFLLSFKYFNINFISLKYSRNLYNKRLPESEEYPFKYILVPTTSITIKF